MNCTMVERGFAVIALIRLEHRITPKTRNDESKITAEPQAELAARPERQSCRQTQPGQANGTLRLRYCGELGKAWGKSAGGDGYQVAHAICRSVQPFDPQRRISDAADSSAGQSGARRLADVHGSSGGNQTGIAGRSAATRRDRAIRARGNPGSLSKACGGLN